MFVVCVLARTEAGNFSWRVVTVETGETTFSLAVTRPHRKERTMLVVPCHGMHGVRIFSFGGVIYDKPIPDTEEGKEPEGFDIEYIDVDRGELVSVATKLPYHMCRGAAGLIAPGTAVVCGGVTDTGKMCIEIDLDTFATRRLPDMIEYRRDHAVVLYRGAIVAVGGFQIWGTDGRSECEQLVLGADKWTAMAAPTGHYPTCSAVVVDELLYVYCRYSMEVYDGTTWNRIVRSNSVPPVFIFEYKGALAAMGAGSGPVETFDPATATWTELHAPKFQCRICNVFGSF